MNRKQFLGLMAGAALAVCAPLSAQPSKKVQVVTLAIGGMS
jgi:hypothetical protein